MKVKYSGVQATKYAQFAEGSYSWNFVEKPAIERQLKPILKDDSKVLDAGCGTGRTIKLLLDLGLNEDNLTGTDISSDVLKIAKYSFPGVKLIKENLPDLEVPNDSLDIVVSNMTFHYLNQKDFTKTIKNIAKWLRKEGYLLFVVVHPLRFASNYREYFNNKVKMERTPWGTEIEYYPKKISDYINAVIHSGFELLDVEEPEPEGEEAREDKKEYEKYSSIPTRLFVNAVKR